MLTVLFSFIGSVTEEISSSIIKFVSSERREAVYIATFMNSLIALGLFIVLGIVQQHWIFQLASLPTFLLRAGLEIMQIALAMRALVAADRSTFVLFRNLTIPFLVLVDVFVGFRMNEYQWWGIGLIFLTLILTVAFRVVRLQGAGVVTWMALNAVATLSLFKYNTSHFNSVEAEQSLIYVVLIVYLWMVIRFSLKTSPFSFIHDRALLGQGFFSGIASVFSSFALHFGNPAVAVTAMRGSGVLAGIVSGHNYFAEKKFALKLVVSALLILGLYLLTR